MNQRQKAQKYDELQHDLQAQELVDKFNALYPIGSKVMHRTMAIKSAPFVERTVRTEAYLSNSMQPVAHFEEISGYCSIEADFVQYPTENETTVTKDFTPQFKELKFKTNPAFEEWLKKTTAKKVFFKDNGQDLLKIWVHESGEILHCNLQGVVWNGMFVNLDALAEGSKAQFWYSEYKEWVVVDFEVALIK